MNKNLILMGFKASGKTTLGKLLAKKLNKPFYDTDDMVVEKYFQISHKKASCSEIFSRHGEQTFRMLEKVAIWSLQNEKDSIIATGGGSFLLEENRVFLKNLGLLINLQVPFSTIKERLANISDHCFSEKKEESWTPIPSKPISTCISCKPSLNKSHQKLCVGTVDRLQEEWVIRTALFEKLANITVAFEEDIETIIKRINAYGE